MIIPPAKLSSEALDALIEEFVTRDGTNLADAAGMIEEVRKQLDSGDIVITFDDESGSCNIVRAEDVELF